MGLIQPFRCNFFINVAFDYKESLDEQKGCTRRFNATLFKKGTNFIKICNFAFKRLQILLKIVTCFKKVTNFIENCNFLKKKLQILLKIATFITKVTLLILISSDYIFF